MPNLAPDEKMARCWQCGRKFIVQRWKKGDERERCASCLSITEFRLKHVMEIPKGFTDDDFRQFRGQKRMHTDYDPVEGILYQLKDNKRVGTIETP